jgi:HSP20 family molecular chaperone IbpA
MTDIKNRSTDAPHRAEPGRTNPTGVYVPRVDVLETDAAYLLRADLPGVSPENVSLHCKAGELVLHARCGPGAAGKRPVRLEYGTGDYFRAFRLGDKADCSAIEARLAAGVLTIHIPKVESARPKTIAVRGA